MTTRNFHLYEQYLFNRSQSNFSDFQTFPNKLVYIRVYTLGDIRRVDAPGFVKFEHFKFHKVTAQVQE